MASARAAQPLTGTVEADLDAWDAWRPEQAAALLAGVQAPWYVAAGWAIDLFLGGQRRAHEDLEIAVPCDCFGEVADALAGYELHVPLGDGTSRLRALDPAGDALVGTHQTWVREPASGKWKLDVFREPAADGLWVCRRDETIRLPYDEVILRTPDGIPFARPEIVLLFKAKHTRARDEEDLSRVLPRLEPTRRRLLTRWLKRVHPGHAWLDRLG